MEGIVPVSRLILYDTSNFIDFPIGGQLTSIGNFLRYLCERHPERTEEIVLVGVTTDPAKAGRMTRIERFGRSIRFLPAAVAQTDLGSPSKSLRLQYAKGLLRCRKLLHIRKHDCNYIHTPEAYGVVKLFCPRAQCVIFSHGSYFNMERGFRFFQKNVLVKKCFNRYLKWILKDAEMILLLDRDSLRDYGPYNSNLVRVSNSIVCPGLSEKRSRERDGSAWELLFVGRLSKDKRVEPIIRAVTDKRTGKEETADGDQSKTAGPGGESGSKKNEIGEELPKLHLTVVGSGEEYGRLIAFEGENVHFAGAVPPEQVKDYMQKADIVVMNSVFEGVPMTILEALSFGLPVVSTNVGGIGDALHFGQDSEETDGTAVGIRAAVKRITANYRLYSDNARENSRAFDYRQVNGGIYELLCRYWRENDENL